MVVAGKFLEGQYRNPTGYTRQRLSPRNIQMLGSSGEVDDELWILLEYYSEVKKVGTNYLKHQGIYNHATRERTFKHFQAYVRQAKSYYYSAKTLPPRSSGLLYYYCFLNLAKAALQYPKSLSIFLENFEKIDLPQRVGRYILSKR